MRRSTEDAIATAFEREESIFNLQQHPPDAPEFPGDVETQSREQDIDRNNSYQHCSLPYSIKTPSMGSHARSFYLYFIVLSEGFSRLVPSVGF